MTMNRKNNGFFYQQKDTYARSKLTAFLNYLTIKQPQLLDGFDEYQYEKLVTMCKYEKLICRGINNLYNYYNYKQHSVLQLTMAELITYLQNKDNIPCVVAYLDYYYVYHTAVIKRIFKKDSNYYLQVINTSFSDGHDVVDIKYVFGMLKSDTTTIYQFQKIGKKNENE